MSLQKHPGICGKGEGQFESSNEGEGRHLPHLLVVDIGGEELCSTRLKGKLKGPWRVVHLRHFAEDTVCGPVDNVEDCDSEGWQQVRPQAWGPKTPDDDS